MKGGIIGLITGIFLSILINTKKYNAYYQYATFPLRSLIGFLWLAVREIFPAKILLVLVDSEAGGKVLIIFNFFIIGAIIGWITGKIKRK